MPSYGLSSGFVSPVQEIHFIQDTITNFSTKEKSSTLDFPWTYGEPINFSKIINATLHLFINQIGDSKCSCKSITM